MACSADRLCCQCHWARVLQGTYPSELYWLHSLPRNSWQHWKTQARTGWLVHFPFPTAPYLPLTCQCIQTADPECICCLSKTDNFPCSSPVDHYLWHQPIDSISVKKTKWVWLGLGATGLRLGTARLGIGGSGLGDLCWTTPVLWRQGRSRISSLGEGWVTLVMLVGGMWTVGSVHSGAHVVWVQGLGSDGPHPPVPKQHSFIWEQNSTTPSPPTLGSRGVGRGGLGSSSNGGGRGWLRNKWQVGWLFCQWQGIQWDHPPHFKAHTFCPMQVCGSEVPQVGGEGVDLLYSLPASTCRAGRWPSCLPVLACGYKSFKACWEGLTAEGISLWLSQRSGVRLSHRLSLSGGRCSLGCQKTVGKLLPVGKLCKHLLTCLAQTDLDLNFVT